MKKKLAYVLILVAVLMICGLAAFTVSAQTSEGAYPPIIQKLVERFNLNPDEVKAVFDEARADKQAQMQEKFSEQLDKAVENGKITAEQKQLIIDHQQEMQAQMQALKDLTPEEREAKMKELREEMKTWAEENGIDFKPIGNFNKFKKPGLGKFHGGFGQFEPDIEDN